MTNVWDETPARKRSDAARRARDPCASLDPAYVWARHTGWKGVARHAAWDAAAPKTHWVRIIAAAANHGELQAALGCSLLEVPPVYHHDVPGASERALFFTARILKDDLEKLATVLPTLRWELAVPLRDAERAARGSMVGRFGPERSRMAFRARNLVAQALTTVRPAVPPPRLPMAMAVVDFGCPFLNTRLAPAPRVAASRVARLWDQGGSAPAEAAARAPARWPWREPARLAHGREIHPDRLQAIVQRALDDEAVDETDIYRSIDYLIDYEDPRRRIWYATHGSHVLDMAAGTVDPLTGAGDPVSEVPIVFVQLPSLTAADSSGASLGAHLLDAVRYAIDQCEDGAPLVVNISYGSHGGPHDGSTLVEQALDDLVRLRQKNFAVVLAAGNSRGNGTHVARTLRPDRSVLLRCAIAAEDPTDTFVEAWYGAGVQAGDVRVQARSRSPDGVWSRWVDAGDEVLQRDAASGGQVTAMLRHVPRAALGSPQGLVLLALAPTCNPADQSRALAEPGGWHIEIRLVRGGGPVAVRAWIERDDAGMAVGRAAHRFLDLGTDDDLDTLSSLASGRDTIVVGGFRLQDRSECEYSAIGPPTPDGRRPTRILAACERDEFCQGIDAMAVRSDEVYRMNGTSVAAPVLARRLLGEMLARGDIVRSQWDEVIDDLAADPAGPIRRASG